MNVELKVVGGSRSGMVIPITIPQFMIGRAEDCHLKPRSELISRYHCALLSEPSYVAVRDLGSKNGVYVNGERIGVEQELKNGDRLAIGPLEFEVVIASEAPVKTEPTKPEPAKQDSIADYVARVVAADAVAPVKTAPRQEVHVAPAAQATPAPQPAPAAQATPAPQPAPAAQATPAPQSAPAAQATPAPQSAPAAQASASKSTASGSASNSTEDLADWLLGDDEDGISEETQTIQTAIDDLDLPYTPQEPKEAPKEEKKSGNAGPNSSDAAANLLKNFFRGGR